MSKIVKVFGAALDPSDSETKMAMKYAHLNTLAEHGTPKVKYQDPYEAFITESKVLDQPIFQKQGKFPVESWLTPKPMLEDSIFMTPLDFRLFLDNNGCKEYSDQMEKFIEQEILPDIPLMIGADHSLTGGVLSALTKKYGAESVAIIIFDGHFDGIPTNLRLDLVKYSKSHKDEVLVPFPEMLDSIEEYTQIPLSYNCGTFLYQLLEQGVILPKNLIVYGVSDYPSAEMQEVEDPKVKNFVEFYLSYEKKGVKIIPNYKDNARTNREFQEALDALETPYFYLSIDVDVSSLNAVLAARFMEFIGVDEQCLYDAIEKLKQLIISKKMEIIGMDIMEIEVYFLNAELKSGKKDKTLEVMNKFLTIF
ncbi:MAG: arginase family protein [Candidatus Helarchaeota archaeon]